jgi:hypothetical protein
MRPASLAGLLLACCLSAVSAQEPTVWIRGPTPSVFFTARMTKHAGLAGVDSTRAPRPTHWKTGLLIGGGIGGAGLGWLVFGLCNGDNESSGGNCMASAVGGAAIGAVIGGTVGALIGGQVPKSVDQVPAPDSTATSE